MEEIQVQVWPYTQVVICMGCGSVDYESSATDEPPAYIDSCECCEGE